MSGIRCAGGIVAVLAMAAVLMTVRVDDAVEADVGFASLGFGHEGLVFVFMMADHDDAGNWNDGDTRRAWSRDELVAKAQFAQTEPANTEVGRRAQSVRLERPEASGGFVRLVWAAWLSGPSGPRTSYNAVSMAE